MSRQIPGINTQVDAPATPNPATLIPDGASVENEEEAGSTLQQLPTTDPGVVTSPGVPPTVPLTGSANPGQNAANHEKVTKTVTTQLQAFNKVTLQDAGEQNILPTLDQEQLSSSHPFAESPEWKGSIDEVPAMDAEMQAVLNAQIQEQYGEDIEGELQNQQEAEQTYKTDALAERQKRETEIVDETQRVSKLQAQEQQDAKDQVEQYRTDWQKENEAIRQQYADRSAGERKKIDEAIEAEVKQTNEQVASTYAEAEKETLQKKTEAEDLAQKKKDDAAKEAGERSWIGMISDWVSNLLDAVKQVINDIFNTLREAVKFIIEKAKTLVADLIEAAAKMITGLIQEFGEILKDLVAVALAAFPDTAARIAGYIDKAVELATDMVNELAEGLKKSILFILDVIGKAIDLYLMVYQKTLLLIVEGVRQVAVKIAEIAEGLSNVGKGFAAMLPHFLPAMSREALGTDVTSSLPNVERTDAQIIKWNEILGDRGAGMKEDGSLQEPGIAAKSSLNDRDVELPEAPLDIEPSIWQQAMAFIGAGGKWEIGGASSPVTTTQLQQTVFGQEEVPKGTETTGDAENGKSLPDFASMSDDDKLTYYIREMGNTSEKPNAQSTEKAVDDQADDYQTLVAKTGKLSVTQRLGFAGKQMLKGMGMWWQENKAKVYLGMIGILVAAGVVAFFTGGAGLMGLVGLLLKAMTAYFIASAIVRIKDKLGEFFSLSWKGQTEQGGAALAEALAVLISEFVLEYILKVAGKIIKRIKAAIKSTKRASRISKRIKKVRRAAGKTRAGVAVRKGKFVIHSIKKSIGKGVKNVGDLRRRLLSKFGFKKIWFERNGRYLEMWGSFNAKLLLSKVEADGSTSYHIKDIKNPGKVGTRYKGPEGEGFVIGSHKKSSKFVKDVESMDSKQLDKLYKRFDKADVKARKGEMYQNGKDTKASTKGSNVGKANPKGKVDIAAGNVLEVKKLASKVSSRFKKFGLCDKFAASLKKQMKKAGIEGEHIRIDSRARYMPSKSYPLHNGNISENYFHEAIKVGDTIFDNIHHKGIDYKVWLDDLEIDELVGIGTYKRSEITW